MNKSEQIINQTKKWITDVVIGCNFCPFASKVIKQQSVFYQVEFSAESETCLEAFLLEINRLNTDKSFETSFLIFPNACRDFDEYLNLVSVAEELLKQNDYDEIYQLASFHPLYLFAGSTENDAANYTNRSVYPMLHLLREASIDKALEHYSDPEGIPGRNINFSREKGIVYMQMLRDTCI